MELKVFNWIVNQMKKFESEIETTIWGSLLFFRPIFEWIALESYA